MPATLSILQIICLLHKHSIFLRGLKISVYIQNIGRNGYTIHFRISETIKFYSKYFEKWHFFTVNIAYNFIIITVDIEFFLL